MEKKKDIEIVNGNGSNLDISKVYEHISGTQPKDNDTKPKNIVIPKSENNIKKMSKNHKDNKNENKK